MRDVLEEVECISGGRNAIAIGAAHGPFSVLFGDIDLGLLCGSLSANALSSLGVLECFEDGFSELKAGVVWALKEAAFMGLEARSATGAFLRDGST